MSGEWGKGRPVAVEIEPGLWVVARSIEQTPIRAQRWTMDNAFQQRKGPGGPRLQGLDKACRGRDFHPLFPLAGAFVVLLPPRRLSGELIDVRCLGLDHDGGISRS